MPKAKMRRSGAEGTAPEEPPALPPDSQGTTEFVQERTATGLPRPLGSNLQPDQFWAWVDLLDDKLDWRHVDIYTYSLWPRLKRPRGEQFIVKFVEPFTDGLKPREYLHAKFGSGTWQLQANDSDIKGKFRTVCETVYKFRDATMPPKFNLAELDLFHPDNKDLVDELIRDGRITPAREIVQPGNPQQQGSREDTAVLARALVDIVKEQRNDHRGGGLDAAVLTESFKMFSTASQEAVKAALGQVKQENPAAFVELLMKFRDLMAPPAAPAGPSADQNFQTFMLARFSAIEQQLIEERKANRDLLEKLASRKDDSSIDKVIEAIGKVISLKDSIPGLAAAEPKNWREMAVSTVGQHLPDIIELGRGYLDHVVSSRSDSRSMSRPAPPQQAPAANPAPGGGPQTIDVPPPAPGAAPNPTAAAPSPDNPRVKQLTGILADYGQYLVKAFNKGTRGDEFAGIVESVVDLKTYQRLANFTVDEWFEAIKAMEPLRLEFTGREPQLEQFILDFIAYGQDDEDEPGDAPEVATTAAAGSGAGIGPVPVPRASGPNNKRARAVVPEPPPAPNKGAAS